MEIWLSLDLSSPAGTLAIHRALPARSPECLVEAVVSTGLDHSEKLLDVLQASLQKAGIALGQVDRFLTPSGPGSFTGLRIALATLKAFALVGAKPIDTLSASEARALAWTGPKEKILVLTHASMERFVHARFLRESDGSVIAQGETLATGLQLEPGEEAEAEILLDARAREKIAQGHLFPLRASHLAASAGRAKSRRSFRNLEEWISLSPQYYGETRFS